MRVKKSKIEFNDNFLILNYSEKSGLFIVKRTKKLYPENIDFISIETCVERFWFRTYLSEKILIKTNRSVNKISYFGIREFENFQDYKNGLRIFAKKNRIMLRDMVKF